MLFISEVCSACLHSSPRFISVSPSFFLPRHRMMYVKGGFKSCVYELFSIKVWISGLLACINQARKSQNIDMHNENQSNKQKSIHKLSIHKLRFYTRNMSGHHYSCLFLMNLGMHPTRAFLRSFLNRGPLSVYMKKLRLWLRNIMK